MGCLAYILLTGKVLFKEDSDEATLANIKTANLNKDFLKDVLKETKNLLRLD